MMDIWRRMRILPVSEDRTALRREFQGWFSTEWNDLEILWLPHFKEWDD